MPIAIRAARRLVGRKFRAALVTTKAGLSTVLAGARNNAAELDGAIKIASDTMGPFMPIFEYEPPELGEAKTCRFALTERLEVVKIFQVCQF